jgi:tetratricopeptide (TPR) repeat protein
VIEKARGFGYRAAEANFENMIANVALDDHRLVESRQHYERAQQLFHDLQYKGHEAITISNLGNLAWNEDRLEDALELYEDSIKLQKSTKDLRSIGIAVTARADVLRELGRFDEAHKDLESALATMTHKGHERRVSFVRAAFARLAEARGELEEARAHYAEAEMSLEAVGDTVEIGRMLYAAAGIEADLEDPESAEALLARAASLDPASLSPDKTGVGEKRAGMHAVRAYRELALARIEVARSKRMDGDDSTALRRSATARLQAITNARNSLMATSAEVRRVAARLVHRLGGDATLLESTAKSSIRYAGTTDGSGWNTELTGEITISREPGTMLATGRLGWEQRAAQLELRGPDAGGPCVLTGTMKSVDGFPATWNVRFEVELADKVLRGRLIELVEEDDEQDAGEDEICQLAWSVAVDG